MKQKLGIVMAGFSHRAVPMTVLESARKAAENSSMAQVLALGATVLPGLVGDVAIPVKSATATGYCFAADGSDSITASDRRRQREQPG